MTITRRGIVSTIGSGLLLGPTAYAQKPAARTQQPAASGTASKAEFSLRFANNLPLSHPLNVRAKEMAQAIRAQSGGKVDIQIFPASQLGSDTEMLKMLRAGEIDFFTLSGLILSNVVPAAAITGVGFAFPNYDAVWSAMDGDLGASIRTEIGKHNLVAMERIWDNGFRQITSSTKPVRSAEDLRGMKIRVPMSPMWTSLFKALDATPTGINFNEVYSSLQSNRIEGQENPLAVIDAAKLYEVQKYCALTYHMWDGFWFLANRDAWERLPTEVRALIAKRADASALAQRTDIAILNAILQKDLRTKGLTFNQPDPDSFRSQMRKAGFYTESKARFGAEAWAKLEKYTGSLR